MDETGRLVVNTHIHLPPNFSAFDSVEQAVEMAAVQGIRLLGASNYYDYRVYRTFAELARERNIHPLFGIEIIALLTDLQAAGVKINDPGNPGKMYICGKGIARFDPMSAEAAALLEQIRANDAARMAAMVERLAEVFARSGLDTGLDELQVKQQVVQRHGCPLESVYLQERHVAQAFQEALFQSVDAVLRADLLERIFGVPSKARPDDAVSVQNEIRSHLMKAGRPAYVEETFVGFEHAHRLILALGGIPCYPTLADGGGPQICAFEASVEELIATMKARNIHFAEFIPIRNSPEVLARYVLAMRAAGIVVTAGTEHNTRDLIPLVPTCVDGLPIPDAVKAVFREGACVAAAHQERVARGEDGYVTANGRLAGDHLSHEQRIAELHRYGEDLMAARTLQANGQEELR